MSSEGGDNKQGGQPANRSNQSNRRRRSSGGRRPAGGEATARAGSRSSSRPSGDRGDRARSSRPPRPSGPAPSAAATVAAPPVAPAPKPFIADPRTQALALSAWDLARTRKKHPDTPRGQIMSLRSHQRLLSAYEDERGIGENDRSYLRVTEGANGSCLLIHGVSTGPGDLKELADEFFQAKFNVYVLRLPDYGTPENTLSEITWESALNQAQRCFQLLARGGGKVHVVGLGFGATLGLHLSLRENVSSLVLLAPAIMPRESFLQRMAVRLKLHRLKFMHRWLGWNAQLMEGMDSARDKIGKVQVPIYAAQCQDDDRACPNSLRFLQRKARNSNSRFQIFPEGGHAILAAHGKEGLNREILKFCGAR